MVKIISNDMSDLVFTTKKRIRAEDGLVAIDQELCAHTKQGYYLCPIATPDDFYGDELTLEEKIALANYAMDLWARYRESVKLLMIKNTENNNG